LKAGRRNRSGGQVWQEQKIVCHRTSDKAGRVIKLQPRVSDREMPRSIERFPVKTVGFVGQISYQLEGKYR
jgi:hypothetical protein